MEQADRTQAWGQIAASVVGAGLMTAAILAIFIIVPAEKTMGDAQRILYVHVAVAWSGLWAFLVAAGAGAGYLVRRDLAWDHWSQAAAELAWLTNLPEAQAKAKEAQKMVLMNFTGSDWCPWCIKLKNEVFAQPAFAEYAQKSLVLVELDFPRKKAQPEELKKANRALMEKYGIEGFPTLVVLDSQGRKLGQLGYGPGGAKPFIARLEALKD